MMKNKHLFAIFTYSMTFTLSVLLVGLTTSKSSAPVKNVVVSLSAHSCSKAEQAAIRRFLEQDRQLGIDYNADSGDTVDDYRPLTATAELVAKMRNLDESSLPPDVRAAYQIHLGAWNDRLNLLQRIKLIPDSDDDNENARTHRHISESYATLLRTAKLHGVDFHP